jgi:hypothetical protein
VSLYIDFIIDIKLKSNSYRLVIADKIELRWPLECLDVQLTSEGAILAVGCQKESVILYKYTSSLKKFDFLASDRVSRLPSSLVLLDPSKVVMSDKYGEVFVIQGHFSGVDGQRLRNEMDTNVEQSLDTIGRFHVGEPIVKLFFGDLFGYEMEESELGRLDAKENNEKDLFYFSNYERDQVFWKSEKRLDIGWSSNERRDSMDFGSLALTESHKNSVGRRVLYGLSITGSLFGFLQIPILLFEQLQVLEAVLDETSDFFHRFGLGRKEFRKSLNFVDLVYLEHFLEIDDPLKKTIVERWNYVWKEIHTMDYDDEVTVLGIARAIDILRLSL